MLALKAVGLDSNYAINAVPYVAHWPLVMLGDWFLWRVGKQTVGVNATRVATLLLLFNQFQLEYLHRCFGNALEQILSVVAFHFYLKQGNRFTLDTAALTALITVAFVGRNTSVIGWIPLLAIKVLRDGALPPFILSAITVAVPVIGLTVLVDTAYYGSDEWVVTSWNFLKVNLVENLSRYFGTDPWHEFMTSYCPRFFHVILPVVLYANTVGHAQICWSKGQTPYMTYCVVFFVFVFSCIPHKEERFFVPIFPFTLLTTGENIVTYLPKSKRVYGFCIRVYMAVSLFWVAFNAAFQTRGRDVPAYLLAKEEPVHSFWAFDRYEAAYQTAFHGSHPNQTKIYQEGDPPKFVRLNIGEPLPLSSHDLRLRMVDLYNDLHAGRLLPEYIEFQQSQTDTKYLLQAIFDDFKIDGERAYFFDKMIPGDWASDTAEDDEWLWRQERFVYKLDTTKFTPI
jgi:hypothetical protein